MRPVADPEPVPMDFAAARRTMVESQIRPNRVTDRRVLEAMAEVPREAFVPAPMQGVAYVDEAIALGGGRHVMEPLVLARLLQAAEVDAGAVVLDVGCGTGYSAAVLARLANTVVALESDAELAARATKTLAELGIDTVAVIEGGLEAGVPDQGPYDVIFLDGAVARVPPAISAQLAVGGRLVAVVDVDGVGRGTLVTNFAGIIVSRQVFDGGTPALPGFAAESAFVF